jgi:uncharacterized membrane protein YfcA
MSAEAVVLALFLGFWIGVSLGLLGGGGSILTVPALVYLVGLTPQASVTASLAIVGLNSAIGAFFHHRSMGIRWKVTLVFGGAGMVTAYFAGGLSQGISSSVLMTFFALLMLLVGGLLLLQKRPEPMDGGESFQPGRRELLLALVSGTVVGVLTGVLGVGGGFLIVPALVLLVKMPVAHAVGASLAIIAANSFAGLLGHMGGDWNLLIIGIFVVSGAAGTLVGTRLSRRLPAQVLRKGFAVFVLVLGVFLLVDHAPNALATLRLFGMAG